MTDLDTTETPTRMFVGVGIENYEHLGRLPRAATDVRSVEDILVAAGFAPQTFLTGSRDPLWRGLRKALPKNGLAQPGTALVVLWSGHARQNLRTGSLRLLTAGNAEDDPDGDVITADQLAEVVAASGASQVVLFLDTCQSGKAVVDVTRVVDAIEGQLPDHEARWFGIVASCQDYAEAVDGALARKLLELLEAGPRDWELRIRWSAHNAGLRPDDLVDALIKEWDEHRQTPKLGGPRHDARPVLPNPLFRARAADEIVEHLKWAARGAAQTESGIWFTGRAGPLRKIVAWLGSHAPGLCALTGSAGCGKSAVVGRIVSLSDPDERAHIGSTQTLPPPDLDPGERSITAHVQTRGATLEKCSEQLARKLGVIGRGRIPNQHDLLAWASRATTPPTIVIDGLDEAGPEAFRIARELLAPLAQYALVLVTSREIPRPDTEPTLLETLGMPALRIDLDADRDATDRDVHDYVIARLTSGDGTPIDACMDPHTIAAEFVHVTRADHGDNHPSHDDGQFLLARILTSQLMHQPADTSTADWRNRLAVSIEEALQRDLTATPPRRRDEIELPQAGRELLRALAYSYGQGFPADDIWPAVATVLSPTGTEYARADTYWALEQYGRYITASGSGGQAVYRLHQRLVDTLRESDGSGALRRVPEAVALRIARAVVRVYERLLEAGSSPYAHRYLWLYAWRHAADAGLEGIDEFERLAARDWRLKPDVANALDNLRVRYTEMGRPGDAVAPAERAVEILGQFRVRDVGDILAYSLNRLANCYSAAGRQADAVAPMERAVHLFERLAGENPAFLDDLAGSLTNLGISYGEVGRRADAVAPTERAVQLFEQLVAENPADRPGLATSLTSLGNRYSEVGRRADAVAPTERAVELFEQLAGENPAVLADLAASLTSLGNRYSQVGRRASAVAPTERAVQIYERLAAQNPADGPGLATSLTSLGNRYGEVGRRDEAVASTERAVQLFEQLVRENAAFLGNLAISLNRLGIRYHELGRSGDAVAPTERAVELFEQLARDNPVFLADLARSLNDLGVFYSGVEQDGRAIAPTERAVQLFEQLADENPAFLGDLAMSLDNLGLRYNAAGRSGDAVAPTERAVHLYEQLARESPAFLDGLANALHDLGACYGEVGRRDEAVASTERAVQLFEQLADESPAFLAHLAMSLNNLGIRYSEAGRRADAVAPIERAAQLFEQLADENPRFLPNLAASLTSLGNRYYAAERSDEAVAATERAAQLYEQLAGDNPAFLADLAMSLNNLGVRYNEVGRSDDAVAPTERAVQLFEQLADENPAFLPSLAGSLANLGAFYSEAGRSADAVAPTERAVQLYEQLADENPAFLPNLAISLNNLGNRYSETGDKGAGDRRWRTVLARLAADPIAGIVLRLRRAWPEDERAQAVEDLLDAAKLDTGVDSRLTWELHRSARELRARNPEDFDARWRAAMISPLPDWLFLDEEILNSCVDWLNRRSWTDSHDYLRAHEDLVSDAGETALAEMALKYPNYSTIGRHQQLLHACRQDGIDAAYQAPLIQETVQRWRSLTDLDDAKDYLLEHQDQIVTDDGRAALELSDSIGQALLELAHAHEIDLGYRLLTDPPNVRAAALTDARRRGTATKLHGIALLCYATATDESQRAHALTHIAISHAVGGHEGTAVETLQGLPATSDVPALIAEISDTIIYRPSDAANLAALIQALTQPALSAAADT